MDFSSIRDVSFILMSKAGVKKRVRAHKIFLAFMSPVFRAQFASGSAENDEIHITDATAEGFMEFLQLFYKLEMDFTVDNIAEVLRLIDKYETREQTLIIVEWYFLDNHSGENVCYFLDLAKSFRMPNTTIQKLELYMKMFAEIAFQSPTFPLISKATLEYILSSDIILFCHERSFLEAAIYWSKSALSRKGLQTSIENVKEELGEAMKLIRFPTLSAKQFGDILEQYPNILQPGVCADILGYIKEKKPLTVAGEYSIVRRRVDNEFRSS